MIKQSKKKLLAFLTVGATIGLIFALLSYAKAPCVEEQETVSEIAEQKSVIDEQAMMLPLAGVSKALYGKTLVLEKDNMVNVESNYVEEKEPVEIYNDGWTNASVNLRAEPNTDSEILTTLKYNSCISYTQENDEWVKVEYEDGFAYLKEEYISNTENEPYEDGFAYPKEEYISDTENEPLSPYYELIANLTDNEKYLIYQITYLEAGNQSMEGQRAVIEVILNRVLSDKYPDTVEGVLSQSGQFVTWKNRNAKSHNEEQEKALELVFTEQPVLTLDYMMFSMDPFSWGRNYVKIGDHWFGTF